MLFIYIYLYVYSTDHTGAHLHSRPPRAHTASVQMETLLARRRQQAVAQHLLGRIVGQFQVVHARVHRRIAAGAGVHLAHHRQARMQIGQTAWRQTAAAGGELQEGLALGARHLHQHVHEAQEAGTEMHARDIRTQSYHIQY